MNKTLSTLLTSAILTGLMAAHTANAEETKAPAQGDQVSAEKNACKGHDKNSCKGNAEMKKKKKKGDKNSCKNGCGEAKKDETKKEEPKKDH